MTCLVAWLTNYCIHAIVQVKGIDPLVPMLQHGLTKGTADQKREAAQCYADLLRLVDGKFIQKVVIKITGPLIRILGDRWVCCTARLCV